MIMLWYCSEYSKNDPRMLWKHSKNSCKISLRMHEFNQWNRWTDEKPEWLLELLLELKTVRDRYKFVISGSHDHKYCCLYTWAGHVTRDSDCLYSRGQRPPAVSSLRHPRLVFVDNIEMMRPGTWEREGGYYDSFTHLRPNWLLASIDPLSVELLIIDQTWPEISTEILIV